MPLIKQDDSYYAAEMTNRQFRAIDSFLSKKKVVQELSQLNFLKKLRRNSGYDSKEIEKWLYNSWNTEFILKTNLLQLDNEGLRFAVQWGFPQAYYSIFASTLAYFIAKNYTERSHSSVRKKFGSLVKHGKYPENISFYCTGVKKNIRYHNISKTKQKSSLSLNPSNDASIETQICQFLKSTREILLKDRREDMKKYFRTKKGKIKKNLSQKDWRRVSSKVGVTSVIDLLYRKRIKSNYSDIKTYQHQNINAHKIFATLISLTDIINLIHESYLTKLVGIKNYQEILDKNKIEDDSFLRNRFQKIKNLI